MAWIFTFAQSIVPSSGSVTVTVNFTWSPNSNRPPSGGRLIFTVGAVLPTTIGTFAVAVLPPSSFTVSTAVKLPVSV